MRFQQNYPNPFNPETKIKYTVPNQSFISIKVYDGLGKEVTALVNETKAPGTYEVNWDASNFPSGVYFYSLISGSNRIDKKMVLLK